MPAASLRAWTELISSFSVAPRPVAVDVGTGTGMFAAALAAVRDVRITVGVDPSAAMLRQAARNSRHPRVRYVAGDAAALPVAGDSVDLALLSRVIHHLPDRRRCVGELHRVLRPGGVVVIRTTVRERLDALVYDYWPRLREADTGRFPALRDVVSEFTGGGFLTISVRSFDQPVQPSLRAYYDAVATRPQSKFGQLDDEQFAAGLARLHRDATNEVNPREVTERYDVLVFTKSG